MFAQKPAKLVIGQAKRFCGLALMAIMGSERSIYESCFENLCLNFESGSKLRLRQLDLIGAGGLSGGRWGV